ncbi:MAG: TCP-1/cpn60 chaperonin family protein [Thermoproteota archaeon]|nr:TCP-1/cpn60 chaperonin family protein [Thermoproteota archaeon]MDQ3883595.1 TCP-1/cpn60 chaperonin family protein [Thermoproteota archaeon]
MSIQQQQQSMPIVLLREGTTETKGNQAQRNNITAAKTIAEIVRTSLGPRGMDKMLVNNIGDVTITNDGATILKEIDVQHPAAKMMVEISKATDNEVGDGTTSTVVLAGSLLSKAEELIAKDVHPTVIVDGYRIASEKAIEMLKKASTKVDPSDRQILGKIARTSMASKLVSVNAEPLSKIVVDAVIAVAQKGGENTNNLRVDADNIKVEKKAGGSIEDTKLIQGIVLDKEVVHGAMPKHIEEAKIALLNAALEIEKTEMSAEIRISDPHQMQMFLEEENRMLKSMVDKIAASGANVLLCQKGIDDLAQHYLAKGGILAVRRVKESDMNNLAKATEGRVVSNIDELSEADLGYAKVVDERKVETDKWVFVEGCKNPKAVSILVRGGSQRVVDEAERSVHDAIMAVKDVVEYPYITVGAGAPEVYISQKIREWSTSLSGRSQLAVERFADSVEEIAIALAENAGMDPLDTQAQLRAKSALSKPKYGVDVLNGKVADMAAKDIYEPLKVKEQVISAATEASSMILRIDDVIAASKSKESAPPPGGGMGGMGGPNPYMDM